MVTHMREPLAVSVFDPARFATLFRVYFAPSASPLPAFVGRCEFVGPVSTAMSVAASTTIASRNTPSLRRRLRAFCRASLMSSSAGSEPSFGALCSVGVIIIGATYFALRVVGDVI